MSQIVAVEPVEDEGCKSDEECPLTQACISRECRDPCNCGRNADCTVVNHRPICRCKAGFEGNPHIACELGNEPLVIICFGLGYSKIFVFFLFEQLAANQTLTVHPIKLASTVTAETHA